MWVVVAAFWRKDSNMLIAMITIKPSYHNCYYAGDMRLLYKILVLSTQYSISFFLVTAKVYRRMDGQSPAISANLTSEHPRVMPQLLAVVLCLQTSQRWLDRPGFVFSSVLSITYPMCEKVLLPLTRTRSAQMCVRFDKLRCWNTENNDKQKPNHNVGAA